MSGAPAAAGPGGLERLRAWARAPRPQRLTASGWAVLGLQAVCLPAAILSGESVGFFCAGLLLALLFVSRLLAAAAVRRLQVTAGSAEALPPRVGAEACVPLVLHHRGRWLPAPGIVGRLVLTGDVHSQTVELGPLWALPPGGQQILRPLLRPQRRGLLQPSAVRLSSATPWGLVEQARTLRLDALPALWCAPAAIDMAAAARQLQSQLGQAPLQQAGQGDEFFSLRPYRPGDDLRRIAWRQGARHGRLLVIEPEAVVAREVLLQWRADLAAGGAAVEHAVACFCGLGEALLRQGYALVAHSHGLLLHMPRGGRAQRDWLLACAQLNPRRPLPALPRRFSGWARVGLWGPGSLPVPGTQLRLPLPAAA